MSYSPADQYYRRSISNTDPRGSIIYKQSIPSSNPVSLPSQDYVINPLSLSQSFKAINNDDSPSRKYD